MRQVVRILVGIISSVVITIAACLLLGVWLKHEAAYKFRMESLGTPLPATTQWRIDITTRLLNYFPFVAFAILVVVLVHWFMLSSPRNADS